VRRLSRKCEIIDSHNPKGLHGLLTGIVFLLLQLLLKMQLELKDATHEGPIEMQKQCFQMDRLVVRVPVYRSGGPGSKPGATRFSEKYWVWNGVYSAS
jgi:hypothetical protein